MHLAPAIFDQLRTLIYEKTGLHFQDNKKYLLESRLQVRLRERNCKTFEEYWHLLRYDAWRDKELSALFELVTTNETYFCRDAGQLQAFVDVAVPVLLKANERTNRLRIWSAACSTGDEPYTLAMMLFEHRALAKWTIEILGSDISEAVLAQARSGRYGPYAVRQMPAALRQKYFTEEDGQFVLGLKVKQVVRFANINLYDSARLKLIRDQDVIFCRNCLIYFDDNGKRKIVDSLYDSLRPGGYLIIGFSESLHGVGRSFKPVHANRTVMYQKA
ncbi:MAG: protein-glutamate O-methyltransferase CheR [Nitrospirae bacterium]|nr:protein-glutamate O-methyltransferase CheR [Nitrospirota bacterium]